MYNKLQYINKKKLILLACEKSIQISQSKTNKNGAA